MNFIKTLKALSYPALIWVFSYTNINVEYFLILTILILFDSFTGVWKAIVVGKNPTSRRFIIGIISKYLLLSIPFLFALLAKVTTWDRVDWFVNSSIMLICIAQWYSILQNITSIRTMKDLEEYDAVTMVLTYLQKRLRLVLYNLVPEEKK